MDAARHLLKKAHRYMGKFSFKPLVCLVVEVFVKPQCREASAVRKTHFLADRVVTFVMRHLYEKVDGFSGEALCVQTPLGIEILRKRGHKRQDTLYFEAGEARHDGVQRDGVAHYRGDLRHQPGHR